MQVEIRCPKCGQRYEIEESHLRRKARCAQCGRTFLTESSDRTSSEAGWPKEKGDRSAGESPPGELLRPPDIAAGEGPKQPVSPDDQRRPTGTPPPTPLSGGPVPALPTLPEAGQEEPSTPAPPSGDAGPAHWSPQPPAIPAPQPAEKLPEQIGRFKIRRKLGSGAFGVVYQAHDPVLDREVALKVPRAAALSSPEAQARFLREPKAAAQLHHKHIVPVYDAGIAGDQYYIASAYIRGRTLEDVIEEDRPGFDRAAEIVRSLAEALEHAHQLGIVHRDVKPGNIMIDSGGQALLMDFGLARIEHSDDRLTHDRTWLGTPAYMSPEQADRDLRRVGPASDQYSLGVVLYELLTGDRPFSGRSEVVIFNIKHQEPEPPRARIANVPRDLEAICLKAMAKTSRDRYAHCGQLAEDLRRYLEREPTLARPPRVWEQFYRWARRNPAVASLIAAVLGVTLLGLVLVTWAWRVADDARVTAQRAAESEAEQRELAEKERDEKVGLLEKNNGLLYVRSIHLAYTQWLANDVKEAQRTLDNCPEDREHWERWYLDRLFRSGWTLRHHGDNGQISGVAYSPDGSLIATAGWDHVVKIWDAQTRREKRELRHPSGRAILCVAFSPDGGLVATGNYDGTVMLWDPKSGHLCATIPVEVGKIVWSVAFSPDGKHVAAAAVGSPKVWSLENIVSGRSQGPTATGALRAVGKAVMPENVLAGPSQEPGQGNGHSQNPKLVAEDKSFPARCVAFSPDGKYLALGGVTGAVRLWEWQNGTATGTMLEGHEASVTSVAFAPDGTRLASASDDKSVRLWSLQTSRCVHTLREHDDVVLGVAFSLDGRTLASASSDRTVKVWDGADGKLRFTLRGHSGRVWNVAFSPDGRWLVSASDDKTAKVWNATTGQDARTLTRQDGPVNGVAASPDGRWLAAAVSDGNVLLWKLEALDPDEAPYTLPAHQGEVRAVAFDLDSKWLASAGDDSAVALWKIEALQGNQKPEHVLSDHKGPVRSIAFGPKGLLVSADLDGTIMLWDLKGHLLASLPGHSGPVNQVAFSPDGRRIASCGTDGTVVVWNVAADGLQHGLSREKSLSIRGANEPFFSVTFSHDGGQVAAANAVGTIALWNLATGRPILFRGGGAVASSSGPEPTTPDTAGRMGVNSLTMSSDGKRIVTGNADGTVEIWDTTLQERLLTLRGHGNPVFCVVFGAQGARLFSASADGTVRIWEGRSPQSPPVESNSAF